MSTENINLASQSKQLKTRSITKIVDLEKVYKENSGQRINVVVKILNSRPSKYDWMVDDGSAKTVMVAGENFDQVWEKFADHLEVNNSIFNKIMFCFLNLISSWIVLILRI
jgi:hypothetical protein